MSDPTTTEPSVHYLTIGNSDDKLTQVEWNGFHASVDKVIRSAATAVYGAFVTESTSMWQSACWSCEIPDDRVANVQASLAQIARRYGQDAIAHVTGTVEMIYAATKAYDPADDAGTPMTVPAPAERPATVPSLPPADGTQPVECAHLRLTYTGDSATCDVCAATLTADDLAAIGRTRA